MDSCATIGTAGSITAMVVSVIACFDCFRRDIPLIITKLRLSFVVFFILQLIRFSTSTNPDAAVHGSILCLNNALGFIFVLYLLENFVDVLLGLGTLVYMYNDTFLCAALGS